MEERRSGNQKTAFQVWPTVLKCLVKWNMMAHSTSLKMETMIGLDTSFHIRTRTISICSLPQSGTARRRRGLGRSRGSMTHHKLTLVKLSSLTLSSVDKYCGNISRQAHHTIEMVIHYKHFLYLHFPYMSFTPKSTFTSGGWETETSYRFNVHHQPMKNKIRETSNVTFFSIN